jgi:hypothetical protein
VQRSVGREVAFASGLGEKKMRRVGCLSLLVAACRCLGDGWVVADPINSRLGARFIEDWSFPVLPVVPGKARKGVCGSQPPHTQEKVNLEGGRGQATIPWRGGACLPHLSIIPSTPCAVQVQAQVQVHSEKSIRKWTRVPVLQWLALAH